MSFTANFIPQPLGLVTVTTPGTKVALMSGLISQGLAATGDKISVNKIYIQRISTNIGSVYIGSSAMNRTTLVGVVAVLTSTLPYWQITDNVAFNKYAFDQWYLDADNATDGVFGSIDIG